MLKQGIAGRTAERLEIRYGTRIGRQDFENSAFRERSDGLLGLQNRYWAVRAFGIDCQIGHGAFLTKRTYCYIRIFA